MSPSRQAIFLAVYLFVSLSLSFSSVGQLLNLRGLDLWQSGHPPQGDIAILAIDSKSLQAIGRWPWSRQVHAKIIDRLRSVDPQLVGYDVVFAHPDNQTDDNQFAENLQLAQFPIVLAAEAVYVRGQSQPKTFNAPLAIFHKAPNTSVGLVNIPVDRDGLARFFPEPLQLDGQNWRPFAQVIAQKLNVELVRENRQLTNLAGSAGTFPTYSVSDWLAGHIPSEKLQHKIILIGATASILRDTVLVPGQKPVLAGVEWHANVIDNQLLKRSKATVSPWLPWLFSLILAMVFLLALPKIRPPIISLTLLGIALAFPIGSLIAWRLGWAWPYFNNSLLAVALFVFHGLYRWYKAEAEKRYIKQTFKNYFSPQVMAVILQDPSLLHLGGQRREVTILFSDIRSFTTITEQLPPEQLTTLLHQYFTEMTEEILTTDGVLDKFIGDAIMAFWGAPIDQPDHGDRAIKAALGMMTRLKKLQSQWIEAGYPLVDIGIGINTGVVTVGNMGSHKRFDYTVIGDDVNAAARLESLNKEYKSHIIIAEATLKKLTLKVKTRMLGDILVKGKTKPIKIYQVE